METKLYRNMGFYEKYIKRILDIICTLCAIIVFSWLYLIVAILVRVKLGSPVIFKQKRPGLIDPETGEERIFCMYKFRSMTDERDADGNLLPDEQRLTAFGKKLRGSSLDELPEAFNILLGDMSIIGPRPQLVRDMVFMTDEQRMRHTARPGLSGLAQAGGREAWDWQNKLSIDQEYIRNVTFLEDCRIVVKTVLKVFFGQKDEPCEEEEVALLQDFGDYLLERDLVSRQEYEEKQRLAVSMLEREARKSEKHEKAGRPGEYHHAILQHGRLYSQKY